MGRHVLMTPRQPDLRRREATAQSVVASCRIRDCGILPQSLLLFVLAVACLGCRGGSWNTGTRVPPPATGSFVAPNSYYQPGAATGPNSPTGTRPSAPPNRYGWSSVNSTSDEVAGTGARASVASVNTALDNADATVKPRLNGMPVNRIRPANEPATFVPPSDMAELPGASNLRPSASGGSSVRTASANQPDRERAGAAADWQTRTGIDGATSSNR